MPMRKQKLAFSTAAFFYYDFAMTDEKTQEEVSFMCVSIRASLSLIKRCSHPEASARIFSPFIR